MWIARALRATLAALALHPAAASFSASPAAAQAAATLPCTLEPGPTRAVAGVRDADTLRLDDGMELRLLGIAAPRASDAGAEAGGKQWPPETDARRFLERLVTGRGLALAFAGPRTDRYGRVLAHGFMREDEADVWLQGRLVEAGMARASPLPESDACMQALIARERSARSAGLGLWSHAAYQVRPADRPGELALYRHTLQLVRGRIERARTTRSLAVLELASSERPPAAEGTGQPGALRIVWRRQVGRTLGLDQPQALIGRNVIVRGWIETRFGPEIEIAAAGQLELED